MGASDPRREQVQYPMTSLLYSTVSKLYDFTRKGPGDTFEELPKLLALQSVDELKDGFEPPANNNGGNNGGGEAVIYQHISASGRAFAVRKVKRERSTDSKVCCVNQGDRELYD